MLPGRRPRRDRLPPSTVSDSPHLFPGTHREIFAISIRLHPAATNPSNFSKDVGSSVVHPKTFPPRASRATSSPEFTNVRFFLTPFPFFRSSGRWSIKLR